jgi:hypothetical protein
MNNPRPSPNHLPADLLMLVGKIAIQSAYLDLLLGEFLSGLNNTPSDERAKTVHALDTRTKTQEAEKIIKTKIAESDRGLLLSLIQRASDLLQDRNLALHAIIAYRKNNLSDPIYVAFRGKYLRKEMPFSKETLDPILKDLDDISRELLGECSKRGYTVFQP